MPTSTTDTVLVAANILTMDDAKPRAQAVAVSKGRIVAVGSREECVAALPHAEVVDLGSSTLVPGFIETHGHTLLSGMSTEAPGHYIAPWLCPTWDDIVAVAKKAVAETPADHGIMLFGLDRLLHGVPFPTAKQMDELFGDRIACMIALSQHQASVTTATLERLGWTKTPPPDPVGAFFDRNPDGSLTGIATEIPAVLPLIAPVFAILHGNPLHQSALYMKRMAEAGYTASSDIGYTTKMQGAYEALVALPGAPMRFMVYTQTTEPDADAQLSSAASPDFLRKNGVKFWADGSPWLGSISSSYPFLDSPATRAAGFTDLNPGLKAMNYTKEELDALVERFAGSGWQIACHVNGDLGLDLVLDAMEAALTKHKLLGTDHRWRLEHVGSAQPRHYQRMAKLGIVPTLGIFQMMQWGDLLDGQLYPHEKGARWSAAKDAFDAGCRVSFHNDGNISRPWPLGSVHAAVTRKSNSGTVHGPEQAIGVEDALKAVTINAAYIMKMDDRAGSIAPGKYADFVQLAADPTNIDPERLLDPKLVEATWVDGAKTDLDAYVAAAGAVEHPGAHALRAASPAHCGCSSTHAQAKGQVKAALAGAGA